MPITAERLQVDVEANTSGAKRDLDQFDSSVRRTTDSTAKAAKKGSMMGGAFKAASGLIAAAAGTMVVGMAVKGVGAASDLNEEVSKTGVVFGGQADKVKAAAQEMADKFGMVKSEFLGAAGGIGLVAKASGMTKKESAGLATSMARLAADASSFYNVPVGEALDAMKSGLVGEAEPMRKFGVLMNEASVNAEALALGIVKPIKNTVALKAAQASATEAQKAYTDAVAEHGQKSPEAAKAALALQKAQEGVGKAAKGVIPDLTEGQKVQARSSLIMKGMSSASGDLARTQSSVANRVRELRGRVVNFAADMGTKALPAVEDFLTVIVEGPGKIKAFVQGIKDWTNAHPGLTKGLQIVAGAVTAVFIPAMVLAAAQAVKTRVIVVASWVAQQAAALKANAAVALSMLKNIAFYVQYGAIVAAQMARAAAAMALNAARVVAGWVLMGTQSLIQAAKMAASWVIALGPVAWVTAAVVALAVLIYKNWDKITAATKRAWSAVAGAVSSAWSKIKGWVSGGASAVSGAVSGAWNKVKSATSSAWEAVKSKVKSAWDSLTTSVKNGVTKVVNWVKGLPDKAKAALSNVGGILKDAGVQIIQGLWDGLKSKWEEVKSWFGSITDSIPDLKGPRAKDRKLLIENGQAIMQGLKEGLNREWKDVKGLFGAMTKWVDNAAIPDSVGDALEKRIRKVGKRVERLTKRAADLAKKAEQAASDLADRQQEKADFRSSAFAGMNNQANVLNSGNSGSSIAKSLQTQVTKVAEFAKNVATLVARGLSKDAIAQITSAGVDGGGEVAAALANATDTDLASINDSFAQIGATATNSADTVAATLYDAGIAAAQAVVDGLQQKQDAIKATLRTIAQSMLDEVRAVVAQAIKDEKAAEKAAADKAEAEKAKAAKDSDPDKPGKGTGGGTGTGKGKRKPAAVGQGAGGGDGGPSFTFVAYNPQAEPQSRTTNRALDRAASLGLF